MKGTYDPNGSIRLYRQEHDRREFWIRWAIFAGSALGFGLVLCAAYVTLSLIGR